MPVKRIPLQDFLLLAKTHPVLDVRSPGEYEKAHIPGAYSLPLFTDEERAVVGTAYKQRGRQPAIKIGLDYFGVKMRSMVTEVEALIASRPATSETAPNIVLVHCWRGGMRSAGVAWLLDLYGFNVYSLAGGYKNYRGWVHEQFTKNWQPIVLGGYTGSRKTGVLHKLQAQPQQMVDLEAIANHKGSAFGANDTPQPKQEMFENLLAQQLSKLPNETCSFWVEDESQRIGNLNIPNAFYATMRNAPLYFIEVPFQQRLQNITEDYGGMSTEKISDAILRIQKRLGPLETKTALQHLTAGNIKECFGILLTYYDKVYTKGLHKRDELDKKLQVINTENQIFENWSKALPVCKS